MEASYIVFFIGLHFVTAVHTAESAVVSFNHDLSKEPLNINASKSIGIQCGHRSKTVTRYNNIESESVTCEDCKCGVSTNIGASIRIVDGINARQNEFPWMVMLATNYWFPICGATLINDKYALTAGHCTRTRDANTGKIELYNEKDYRVVFNVYKRSRPEDLKTFLPIEKYVRHENYDETNYEADIALIRFAGRVKFTPEILPICLPTREPEQNIFNVNGFQATISGWGYESPYHHEAPNILQKAIVPIVPNSECNDLYNTFLPNSARLVRESTLCAGNSTTTVCNGDSGGPLMVNIKGRMTLAGIMSLSNCDATYVPSIYTRVSSFEEWIAENTLSDSCSCRL